MKSHRSLEIFRTVVESGSVTAAAERLGLTQPTVTKAIAEFERGCGFQLFVRGRHGMKLTTEGELIYDEVCSNLNALNRITQRIHATRAGFQGLIRIAVPPIQDRFTALLGEYCAINPDIRIEVSVASPRDVILAVSRDEADIGLLPGLQGDMPHLELIEVTRHSLQALVPEESALARQAAITFEDIRAERLVQYSHQNPLGQVIELSILNGVIQPTITCVVATQRMAAIMAQAGAGIALVDDATAAEFAGAGLVARPVHPPFNWPMRIVRSTQSPASPPIKQLMDWLKAKLTEDTATEPAPVL